jgi:hypothetical protein
MPGPGTGPQPGGWETLPYTTGRTDHYSPHSTDPIKHRSMSSWSKLTILHPTGSLRRRPTAARLLRSWIRIPLGAWMFICCVCLCCQAEVSATSWSLVQSSPANCGASLCVIKKPRERGGHSPRWAAEPEMILIIIRLAPVNSECYIYRLFDRTQIHVHFF